MDLTHLLYRYLPHLCLLCGDHATNILCEACDTELPRNHHRCPTCALPLAAKQLVCGDCLALPKPYALTICPLIYRHPVDQLVMRMKKQNPRIAARAALPSLHQNLEAHYPDQDPWPNLIVPVPSHPWSRLRRGFNQAHALAEVLGDRYQIPVRPLVRHTGIAKPQKSLDRKTRFANLRKVFDCPTRLQGETIAVVDDVITTGATAMLMSECLLKAGVAKVHIWALARTPKPGMTTTRG